MPRNSPSNPSSWRALLNEAFGLGRWQVLGTFLHEDPGARRSMAKLYVVSVAQVAPLLVVQEWPDHGFTYYFETRRFQLPECLAELEGLKPPPRDIPDDNQPA